MANKASKKLQNYQLAEIFIQCNFLDGYEYIDRAGSIVNSLARENKEAPSFVMNLEGLTLNDLSESLKEVRVSSTAIWLHFVEPKNLEDTKSQAIEILDRIIKVLKPTIYQRLGWRTYFIREGGAEGRLKADKSVGSFKLQSVVMADQLEGFEARIEVDLVKRQADPSVKALLFDVDLAKQIETFEPRIQLQEVQTIIRSDKFLDKLEELMA